MDKNTDWLDKPRKASKEWAKSLDGKKVIVFFGPCHQSLATIDSEYNFLGTAKADLNYKWGRLKVFLDSDEYDRIVVIPGKPVSWTLQARFGIEIKPEPSQEGGTWHATVRWSSRGSVRSWEAFSKEYVMRRFNE